jgi:predicted phosphodiesterase
MTISDELSNTPPKDAPTFSETNGEEGHAAAFLPHENATARELVEAAGLDPDLWQLTGNVNTRKWMRYDGKFLYYYKFDVKAGESIEARQLHIEDLTKLIRRRTRKPFNSLLTSHSTTYGHGIADWQIGKAEGGEGSDSTIQRYLNSIEEAEREIKRLRKTNASLNDLALLSTGDLVEGCGGHYDMQTFSVDLDRREQNRVVRELLTTAISTLSPMFEHTTVAAVPGNHGENRHKGKAFTNFSDNDDVATVEAVSESFRLAGWDEDRIKFMWPEKDELSLLVDLNGVPIVLAHGHQFRGGVNALKKADDWWRGQDFGHQAAREAQILLTGHFHSFNTSNLSHNRSWIQQPTIDTGSWWFTNMSGISATRGVLSMVFNSEHPLGYDHLRILPVG